MLNYLINMAITPANIDGSNLNIKLGLMVLSFVNIDRGPVVETLEWSNAPHIF